MIKPAKVTLVKKGDEYLVSKIEGRVLLYHPHVSDKVSRAGDKLTEKEAIGISEIYSIIVKG